MGGTLCDRVVVAGLRHWHSVSSTVLGGHTSDRWRREGARERETERLVGQSRENGERESERARGMERGGYKGQSKRERERERRESAEREARGPEQRNRGRGARNDVPFRK